MPGELLLVIPAPGPRGIGFERVDEVQYSGTSRKAKKQMHVIGLSVHLHDFDRDIAAAKVILA